jgi:predicted peptidase
MRRIALATTLLFACITLSACVGGPATDQVRASITNNSLTGFKYAKLHRGNRVRKYAVFIPLRYDPDTKYPVIIFLHGIGEGCAFGEGDGKQLTVGMAPAVLAHEDTFSFIAIFPQSDGEWDPDSEYAKDVMTALDDVSKKYSVDLDRVTLTGISTGGHGTYAIGAKYSRRFAALVPIASNHAEPDLVDQLLRIPIRAYCSESGDTFASVNDRSMVSRISARGGQAEFIATPTNGHNCWDYVYGDSDVFRWIDQQSRQNPITPRWQQLFP